MQVLFDVRQTAPIHPTWLGVLALIFMLLIAWIWLGGPRRWGRTSFRLQMVTILAGLLMGALGLGAGGAAWQWHRLSRCLDEHSCACVEGVARYHPPPGWGHVPAQLQVGSGRFELSQFQLGPGFRDSRTAQAVDGRSVRILYLHSEIAYLATVEAQASVSSDTECSPP
jgi:hypothetical protein